MNREQAKFRLQKCNTLNSMLTNSIFMGHSKYHEHRIVKHDAGINNINIRGVNMLYI